jgi:pimeloyl-ACP methyl ester carboxylesterase
MRVALAAVVFGLLLAGSARAAPPALASFHPCAGAAGFTCSTLTVPLDHSGRHAGTLKLQVAVVNNAGAPRGVLLLLTGGPGEPGVTFATRLSQALHGLLRDYRLVLYDQRGTGATALKCPALQAAMGSSDLLVPSASAVQACARSLGPARAFYGTDDVVADMELLRQALGVDSWTLDGISYGTFVGERYAIAHPGRVKSLVLDSVVPHNWGFGLLPIQLRAAGRVLRLVCGRACAGDLAYVVAHHHDGPRLLDALAFMSIVDPTFHTPADLAGALGRARAGDMTALDDLLATVRRRESVQASFLSQGLHASALCGDWRFPWGTSAAPLAGRSTALAHAGERLSASDVAPFDRATATGNGIEQQCLPWAPVAPVPAAPKRLPRVPTLLLSGDRDMSTPLEWGRLEASLAPEGRLVVVHGAGHGVQGRAKSDAGRNAVVAFLTR